MGRGFSGAARGGGLRRRASSTLLQPSAAGLNSAMGGDVAVMMSLGSGVGFEFNTLL